MANFVLLFGIIVIEILAIYTFEDLLAPACIVCESFLLAYICACFSSLLGGWNFNITITTAMLIILGLSMFFLGSFFSKKTIGTGNIIKEDYQFTFIDPGKGKLLIMLIVQLTLLFLYLLYYKRSIAQFGDLNWANMIRAYRFTSSYGEGLDTPIPSWVNQVIKLSRANGYVALYTFMHNLAIRRFVKKKLPNVVLLIAIVVLYLPYTILNAARFEFIVVICFGIVIWYSFYRKCSIIVGKRKKNIRKAIRKIAVVILITFVGFTIIAPFVGRLKSDNIISQAVDYFGRSIQAFDSFVTNPTFKTELVEKETIYNIVKFLKQIHVIGGDIGMIHLDFAFQNGISLGNTYTAFRRYYADLGTIGIVLFSFLGGFFFTKVYRRVKHVETGKIDYRMLCYGAIIFSTFLYCFDDYLFADIFSFNYLIIFICLYFVTKWFNGERIIGYKHCTSRVVGLTQRNRKS